MPIIKNIPTPIPRPKQRPAFTPPMEFDCSGPGPCKEVSASCSRAEFLVEQDKRRAERDSWLECERRKEIPGYAKVKDTKYGGE